VSRRTCEITDDDQPGGDPDTRLQPFRRGQRFRIEAPGIAALDRSRETIAAMGELVHVG
jgi:hypothetical protein